MKKSYKHPLVESSRKGMVAQTNLLRRALIEARGSKGLLATGRSLAGGRHLVNTYRSAQSGEVNQDRFKRSFVEPSVDAGASLMLDISGSMTDNLWNKYSIIQNVMASAVALSEVLDKLGVVHRIGGVDVEMTSEGSDKESKVRSTSHGITGVVYPFSKPSGKGLNYPIESIMRFPANGSTYIATYAEVAVDEARKIRAKHRVALYMTDGCCRSSHYLHSLAQQAKRDNITLVGVVMGPPKMREQASLHPNGIYARDCVELSKVVLGHIAKAVKLK